MDELLFEGRIVKASKDGKFRCPFQCHRRDYPRPKWTEKGFIKHMETCGQKPSAVEKRNMSDAASVERYEKMKAEIIAELPFKIGDTLFAVKETIIKPTHVQRETRMAKVRYEADIKFEPYEFTLNSIDFRGEGIAEGSTKDFVIKNKILINRSFWISQLLGSFTEAKERAKEAQISYDAACKFASDCR